MQSSICEVCTSWMHERQGWLRCDCGNQIRVNSRSITPVGGEHVMVDDTFNSEPGGCPAGPGTSNGSDPNDYKKKPKKSNPKLPIT